MKGRSMMVVGFVLPVSVSGILARERLLPPEESMVVSENVWNMLKDRRNVHDTPPSSMKHQSLLQAGQLPKKCQPRTQANLKIDPSPSKVYCKSAPNA
jgi:hypothetical protein